MANRHAIQAANTNRAASRALQAEASDIRASAESYSATTSPTIRAMCEAAVYHASRATDRAFHEPAYASVHLSMAAEALARAIQAEEDGAE